MQTTMAYSQQYDAAIRFLVNLPTVWVSRNPEPHIVEHTDTFVYDVDQILGVNGCTWNQYDRVTLMMKYHSSETIHTVVGRVLLSDLAKAMLSGSLPIDCPDADYILRIEV